MRKQSRIPSGVHILINPPPREISALPALPLRGLLPGSIMRPQYPFPEIEPKWQAFWDKQETFRAWNPGENIPEAHPFATRHGANCAKGQLPPKFFCLDMFPYPSGSGLHVGHPEGYTATDIVSRFKRMKGFNVLHPMGWDAFGLPAEQYAIKTGQHPRVTTEQNVAYFKKQLKGIGFSYDWSREVNTTDPAYFKWTQWIFLKLYNSWFDPATQIARPITDLPIPADCDTPEKKRALIDSKRLAYVSEAPVNWCPQLGTVLANEEVIDGKSEVGGFPVERRPMRQWMLRITEYCERLINELDLVNWPESIKLLQRNWIGRSEGAEVQFALENPIEKITVFTTRPDTLFGATYMVLCPEHELVDQITTSTHEKAVADYKQFAASKSDQDRQLAKDKTGVFTGAYALNPVNNEKIPIWIADYVLAGYGTGAIMAVPAHDERDLEFAQTFGLPVTLVVQAPAGQESLGFCGDGTAVNSGLLNGLSTLDAKNKIAAWLEEHGLGKKTINYKLRDWLFSRQRYWGEPFPIVWVGKEHFALDAQTMPLIPPDMDDFKPTGTPEPPLSKAGDWLDVQITNPYTGANCAGRREVNTMPQWAGSCWYYLRYTDAQNAQAFVSPEAEKYWMHSSLDPKEKGVDLYVGGTEHAVLHLLYARFWHKVIFDLGLVTTPEPFYKLVNQGLILGEDGQKMSKSRGNVVNPDDVIKEYGADSLRLYEMFMGPLEQVKPWSMKGVEGVYRFLGRVWRLIMEEQQDGSWSLSSKLRDSAPTPGQLKVLHATIKKVSEDIENLSLNTAIAQMMIFVNEFTPLEERPLAPLKEFLQLLSPFAPHIAEELWAAIHSAPQFALTPAGHIPSINYAPWPVCEEKYLVESEVEVVIQVNGKLRDKIMLPKGTSREESEAKAMANPRVKEFTEGKSVKKVIVVPDKLVNIVIG